MDEVAEQVQTCGLCEMLCESTEIIAHECLQGYHGYHIDPHTLYFYPVLDDGKTIVCKSLCANREVDVLERISTSNKNISKSKPSSKRSNVKQKNKENDDPKVTFMPQDEKLLISEVWSHPCIWNFSMPLPERNLRTRNAAWDNISEVFQNKFSATQLKRKWKSLHDTYRKIRTNKKLPSEPASKNTCKWSHFDSLSFLQDSCFQIDTSSNFDSSETTSTIDEDAVHEENFARLSYPPRQRKQSCAEETSALTKIADAIVHQSNLTLPPSVPIFPPYRITDDIDGFLSMLGAQLRSLPRLVQLQKMKELSDGMFITVMDAQIAQNDAN